MSSDNMNTQLKNNSSLLKQYNFLCEVEFYYYYLQAIQNS